MWAHRRLRRKCCRPQCAAAAWLRALLDLGRKVNRGEERRSRTSGAGAGIIRGPTVVRRGRRRARTGQRTNFPTFVFQHFWTIMRTGRVPLAGLLLVLVSVVLQVSLFSNFAKKPARNQSATILKNNFAKTFLTSHSLDLAILYLLYAWLILSGQKICVWVLTNLK